MRFSYSAEKLAVLALGLFTAVVLVFLLLPIAVIVVSAFTSTDYVVFPPSGLSLRWFAEAA
ncbi:MAG: hypothetical protein ACK5Q5_18765 [Planctomycetaceae bacterium]